MQSSSNLKVQETVNVLREIYHLMKPRLEAHLVYLEKDHERKTPYPQNALAPSEEVNILLGKLVTTCDAQYTTAESKQIQEELKDIAPYLRDISNLSEGEMERVALNYIFKVFEDDKRVPSVNDDSKQEKTRCLENIVNNIPKTIKLEDVPQHEQFSFPYLKNYDVMAENELRLLTHGKNVPNLENQTITFVGAGFPLSAIMYHIHSGAKINLVDIDPNACKRAEQFLEICHKAGVLNKNDFKVIQGNAMELKYSKNQTKDFSQNFTGVANVDENHESAKQVNTDILVFAAALPDFVKAKALANVSPKDVTVINRCTSEVNNLLYPSTKLSALIKNNGLGKHGGKEYNVIDVMYPEFAFKNKVQDGVNKKGVLSIETDKINQNTAQRLNINTQMQDAGVQCSFASSEGKTNGRKYNNKDINKDKNTSFIAKL